VPLRCHSFCVVTFVCSVFLVGYHRCSTLPFVYYVAFTFAVIVPFVRTFSRSFSCSAVAYVHVCCCTCRCVCFVRSRCPTVPFRYVCSSFLVCRFVAVLLRSAVTLLFVLNRSLPHYVHHVCYCVLFPRCSFPFVYVPVVCSLLGTPVRSARYRLFYCTFLRFPVYVYLCVRLPSVSFVPATFTVWLRSHRYLRLPVRSWSPRYRSTFTVTGRSARSHVTCRVFVCLVISPTFVPFAFHVAVVSRSTPLPAVCVSFIYVYVATFLPLRSLFVPRHHVRFPLRCVTCVARTHRLTHCVRSSFHVDSPFVFVSVVYRYVVHHSLRTFVYVCFVLPFVLLIYVRSFCLTLFALRSTVFVTLTRTCLSFVVPRFVVRYALVRFLFVSYCLVMVTAVVRVRYYSFYLRCGVRLRLSFTAFYRSTFVVLRTFYAVRYRSTSFTFPFSAILPSRSFCSTFVYVVYRFYLCCSRTFDVFLGDLRCYTVTLRCLSVSRYRCRCSRYRTLRSSHLQTLSRRCCTLPGYRCRCLRSSAWLHYYRLLRSLRSFTLFRCSLPFRVGTLRSTAFTFVVRVHTLRSFLRFLLPFIFVHARSAALRFSFDYRCCRLRFGLPFVTVRSSFACYVLRCLSYRVLFDAFTLRHTHRLIRCTTSAVVIALRRYHVCYVTCTFRTVHVRYRLILPRR